MNQITEFQNAIRQAGLEPPAEIEPGKLIRFGSNGKRGDKAAWCKLFPDLAGGVFGDHRSGLYQTWRANHEKPWNPAEVEAFKQKCEREKQARDAEAAKRRIDAQEQAGIILAESFDCTAHDYLTRKGIKANGARLHEGSLVIPIRDTTGGLHSVQFIDREGNKKFLPGGAVAGNYFSIGKLKNAGLLCVCEGFATGASIHEATGYPVAVAFHAGNLQPVAKALQAKYPSLHLIVCADDDANSYGNPGLSRATEAALSAGGQLAIPEFGADRPENATDFNDLARLFGADAVRQSIAKRRTVAEIATIAVATWPEPQTLEVKVAPEPYPIDALPETIRKAVQEVAGFVKAPVPLVASSALAALSLACQTFIDVRRADKLQGPVSLDMLTIADSGERKTTCDGFFMSAIRQYQDEQAEAMKPELERHEADMDAWTAERDGLLLAVKEAGRKGKATDLLRAELARLQSEKPIAPRVPRMLLGDETPENLSWSLAKKYPSAGVVSSEAGLILGAHGMGKDSIMRNLGLLNVLWDGGSHSIGRRTSESFMVKNVRLTVALQIQEATLRSFFDRSGGLARGTGFLARFLVSWPESTQGFRPFTEAPQNWPHLAAFHKRMAEILAAPMPMDDEGTLSPATMLLTPEAKAAWVEYHDAIEGELASGGELYDVRDVASKSADNAARMAGLFQAFEHGFNDAISLESFTGASRVAAWHLNESRRFFGEIALPEEMTNAAKLDAWLFDYCHQHKTSEVRKNTARQFGKVRDGQALDSAIRELIELERIRLLKVGKLQIIQVNPKLLEASK